MTGPEILKRFPVGSYAKIVGMASWQVYANSRDRKRGRAKRKQRIGQVVQILYTVNRCSVWAYFVVQLVAVSGRQQKKTVEIDFRDLEPIDLLDLLAVV